MRIKTLIFALLLFTNLSGKSQVIDSLYNQIHQIKKRISILNDSVAFLTKQIEIQKKYFNPIDSVFKIRIVATVKGHSGIIKEFPDLSSKVLEIKKSGDTVVLVEYLTGTFNDRYFKLESKGFIKDEYVNMTDKLYGIQQYFIDNQKKREIERAVKVEKDEKDEYFARKKYLEKKYGINVASRLLKNQIWLGMTSQMFTEVMGKPIRVNRTVTSSIEYEQWVYGQIENTSYYYFENNKLKSWQD